MSTPVHIAVAVQILDGRILCYRRPETGTYPGCWETPGGKVEDGETPAQAAAREHREETGMASVAGGIIGVWRVEGMIIHAFKVHAFSALDHAHPMTPAEVLALDPAACVLSLPLIARAMVRP